MDHFISDQWLSDEELGVSLREQATTPSVVIYEVVRTYNALPFALKRHFQRLKLSAKLLDISMPMGFSQLVKLVNEGISRNHPKTRTREIQIRVTVFETSQKNARFMLGFSDLPELSIDIYELGVRVGISPFVKPSAALVNPVIKTPGLPWIVLTRRTLGDNYDLIMLNESGNVCEGSFSSLFIVKDEHLVTPDTNSGVLPGITRQLVMKLARSMEVPVEERPVKSWELFAADEAFLTHTSAGIVPVRKIMDHVIIEDFTDGLTRLLLDNFEGFIMTDEENWVGVEQ